jgi:hypothetical protein
MNLLLMAASTGAAGLYGASLYHYHAYAQTDHSAATGSEIFPPLVGLITAAYILVCLLREIRRA